MSFAEEAEDRELFRQKASDNSSALFTAKLSAGANQRKLAQILTAFDLAINILGWQKKPLADLTHFVTHYQASVDTRFHNDYKDVLVAEEIERKRANRKGLQFNVGN